MSSLFPADKHRALRGEPWSASRAEAGVRDILRHDMASFDHHEHPWVLEHLPGLHPRA